MMPADPFYAARTLCIAHRGASDVAPENTLAAFEAALEAEADGVELDVTCCATGEVVVIHDDTVDRTTDGSGSVQTMPLAALRELDAGSWFGPRFRGQRIPTLDEVFDLLGSGMRLNIEIKGRRLRADGIENKLAEMVHARGLEEHVLFSSFNPAALWRLRRVAPDLRRGMLYTPHMPLYLARTWLRPLVKPSALHPHHRAVDAALVRRARAHGCRLNAWTVDEEEDMRRIITLGVDGIITNHPRRLRLLLQG